jgi:beta-glucosidase
MQKPGAIAVAALASALAPPLFAADVAVERRVDSLLSQFTLDEKIDFLGGVDGFFIRDVPRVNWPRLKMADGPLGVRNFGPATAMAGGISLAASWNPALAERVGTEIGRDARAKGVHFLLGPGVNIYRSPLNGRNFEYLGEDPFLAARTAVGYIKGVQAQGVTATVKHFMGNNSEFDRHETDSVIDERTMREIYLPTFEAAVKEARVGAIMDAYNLTNGRRLTESVQLNVDVAKKEWGFDGIVMSDWDATYDAVAAANGGLDLEMPSGKFLNREKLKPALAEGKVTPATIDDKVRRIIRTAVRFGWLDRDQADAVVPRYNLEGRQVALQAAREGLVLLKNEGALLPLDKGKLKTVALIGPSAYPAVPVGGGSGGVEPFAAVSLLQGLSEHLGAAVPVLYVRGLPSYADLAERTNFTTGEQTDAKGLKAEYFEKDDLSGPAVVSRVEEHINYGRVGGLGAPRLAFPDGTRSTRWTGYFWPRGPGAHTVFLQSTGEDGGYYRVTIDGAVVLDNWTETRATLGQVTLDLAAGPHKVVVEQHGRSAWLGTRLRFGIVPGDGFVDKETRALAARADVAIVAVGFDPESETEGSDRTFGLPPGQDDLIRAVAASNKNTIVVITAGGAVDMNGWLGAVPALVHVWYPGQEGGRALAEALTGDVNPSGRLPVTFERRAEDNPTYGTYYPAAGSKKVDYAEGVFVGYRGYQRKGVAAQFPFGFGLSYTTFTYANLAVEPSTEPGTRYRVSFDLANSGSREGAEVAQVYVGHPGSKVPRPAKELKGFAKVTLKPGETKRVSVTLDDRSFSYYDVAARRWRADPGSYQVLVGRSADQTELTGTVTLAK